MKKILLIILALLLIYILTGYCTTYTSRYPPVQSWDYVKTTSYSSTSYFPHYATDPTKSLTGLPSKNSWLSYSDATTNQRFHIDLGSVKVIRRIYYENFHNTGAWLDRGV
ncbi:unnamed protein product, partial [marine sediment metagenome]